MKDLVKAQAGVIPRGQWLVRWMGWAEGTVLPHELWLGLPALAGSSGTDEGTA